MEANSHIENIENELLSLSFYEKEIYLKILNDKTVLDKIVEELKNTNFLILSIIKIETLELLDLVKLYHKFLYGQIDDNCSDELQKEVYLSVITQGMKRDDIFTIPYYFKYLDFEKYSLSEIRKFCREFFWDRDFIVERLKNNSSFYLKYVDVDKMTDGELEEFLLYSDTIVVDNWIKEIQRWSKKYNLNLPKNKEELLAIDKIVANDKKIEYIPKEIGRLQNLQEIDFSNVNLSIFDDNTIENIPKELYNLVNLIKLNVSNNKIKTILPDIAKLKSLEELNISNNLIEELPKELANLTSLKELYISNNKLDTTSKNFFSKSTVNLPKEFINLRELTILDDSENPRAYNEDILDFFSRNNYNLI